MNRRSFFTKLGLAAASFAILPAAATYARSWKPQVSLGRTLWVPNPEFENTKFIMEFIWHPDAFQMFSSPHQRQSVEQFASKRFNVENGKRIYVEPFLKVPVDAFGNPI